MGPPEWEPSVMIGMVHHGYTENQMLDMLSLFGLIKNYYTRLSLLLNMMLG